MKGVPWQPVPGRKTNKIPTRIEEGDEVEEEDDDEEVEKFEVHVEQQKEDEDVPNKPGMASATPGTRAMYVKRQDIKDYGPTKGCIGCKAIEGK
eukprot:10447424-Karenia_brevis.AAC.1